MIDFLETNLERSLRVEALDREARAGGTSLQGPVLEAANEGSRRGSGRERGDVGEGRSSWQVRVIRVAESPEIASSTEIVHSVHVH